MAEPVLVVRVAGNITELRKAMQEGTADIITTKAEMTRFANAFDGSKIISQAGAVMAQIKAIGGATNLTAAEQTKANRILEEALEKYDALGKEAPPGMRKIADETKQVDTTSTSLKDTIKSLALGFVAMFTARAAFNFVTATAAEAGALQDLSEQTRINVEDLQVMAGAMSNFGVTADELGRALFNLSNKIAGKDDSVSDALKQMGMTFNDVKNLNGEELFLTIQRGLASLQGSLRDTTAVELYGSKLGMSMSGAAKGTDEAIDAARRMNTVMSKETVAALDQADEAIRQSKRNLDMLAASMIGPVAEGFNTLSNAMMQGATKWQIFVAMTKDWAASNSVTGPSTENLTRLLDSLNKQTESNATTTKKATVAHREFVPALESTAGAAKFAREETERLLKVIEATMAAQSKMKTEEAREKDKKALEDLNALIERHKSNMEGEAKMMQEASMMEAAANQKRLADEQALEAARIAGNQLEIDALTQTAQAHQTAGDVAKKATDQTIHGFAGVSAQIEISGDAIRAWIELMKYSAEVNLILSENSLFTSRSQKERIAALKIPGKASGGPVSAGAPYMVGERGPELFVPERSGMIVPNGGSSSVTNAPQVHLHGGTFIGSSREFRDAVAEAVLEVYKSGAITVPANV